MILNYNLITEAIRNIKQICREEGIKPDDNTILLAATQAAQSYD